MNRRFKKDNSELYKHSEIMSEELTREEKVRTELLKAESQKLKELKSLPFSVLFWEKVLKEYLKKLADETYLCRASKTFFSAYVVNKEAVLDLAEKFLKTSKYKSYSVGEEFLFYNGNYKNGLVKKQIRIDFIVFTIKSLKNGL